MYIYIYMDVSKNSGTPKSSILIGFSIINHPFWGTPIFGNTHITHDDYDDDDYYYDDDDGICKLFLYYHVTSLCKSHLNHPLSKEFIGFTSSNFNIAP